MFIPTDNATLFATSFGHRSAPAILSLSGWIGSWEDWLEPLSLLSHDWHAISYDHRGSGAAIAPVESITFEALVDDVFVVLDAFKVERCVLAAMSMGAMVALGAALKRPERFSGLVLVNGAVYRPPSQGVDSFLQGLHHNYAATLDYFADLCIPEVDCEPVKRWGRQILDRASQEAAIRLYEVGGSVDLRAEFGRIELPTLILHGDAVPAGFIAGSPMVGRQLAQCHVAADPWCRPCADHDPSPDRGGRNQPFFCF